MCLMMNNILKHSHATEVTISLDEIHKNGIHLTLTDNGCGFDENEIRRGQGINNIFTRTKRINGSIDINSEKGRGTVVGLKIRINPTATH